MEGGEVWDLHGLPWLGFVTGEPGSGEFAARRGRKLGVLDETWCCGVEGGGREEVVQWVGRM